MGLSEEDRKRIEEEETFRAEAKLRAEAEARKRMAEEEARDQAQTQGSAPQRGGPQGAASIPRSSDDADVELYLDPFTGETVSLRKKKRKHVSPGCAAAVIGATLLLFGYCTWSTPWTGPSGSQNPPDPAGRRVVGDLLDEWEKGEAGGALWKSGMTPITPYAVREYEHVFSKQGNARKDSWPRTQQHRYRIKSSNRAGLHIEKLYDIYLQQPNRWQPWKVVDVFEAQDY